MPKLSGVISGLITRSKQKPNVVIDDDEKIKVHSVVSKASFVYEKVRNAVDYNEEHLVRKNAIYRILKRKLLLEKVVFENYLLDKYHQDNIALHLLQELIRGRYISEDTSSSEVKAIDQIIQKYNKLIQEIKDVEVKIDAEVFNYILEMAAVEIENYLIPPDKEKALIQAMFSIFNPQIHLTRGEDKEEKAKEMQVFIGCHRALFKWDGAMIQFMLFNLYFPEWKDATPELIKKVASSFEKTKANLDEQISHPWRKEVSKILQKNVILLWIIQDLIGEHGENFREILNDPEELENEIKKACNKRYKSVNVKLRRGVIRSITYVFFTKMLLALVLELPLDIYLTGIVNLFSLAVNILFPPFLMLVVAVMIRLPKKENTKKIVEELKAVIYSDFTTKKYLLRLPRERGKFAKFIFNIVFIFTFVFSLSVIFWALHRLDFNVFSSLIFVLFLTLVSFFGIRIRRPVKDIIIIVRKESVSGSIVDFFALPFVTMGRLLSEKFSKFNFLAYFMDFIIEAPFKLLLEIFEDLFKFLKEKKEDVMIE